MKKIKVNILITSIIIVIILILSVLYLPLQHKVNKDINGLLLKNSEEQYLENISININGTYKDYLFRDDIFEGTIYIDKYSTETSGLISSRLVFVDDDHATLIYYDHNNMSTYPFGELKCTKDFSNFLIKINDKINDNVYRWNNLFIAGPADNREQAIEIAKNLTKGSNYYSAVEWR